MSYVSQLLLDKDPLLRPHQGFPPVLRHVLRLDRTVGSVPPEPDTAPFVRQRTHEQLLAIEQLEIYPTAHAKDRHVGILTLKKQVLTRLER